MDKMVDSALANDLGLQLLHVDSGRAQEVADMVMALLLGLLCHTHVLASYGYASAGWECFAPNRDPSEFFAVVSAIATASSFSGDRCAVCSRWLKGRNWLAAFVALWLALGFDELVGDVTYVPSNSLHGPLGHSFHQVAHPTATQPPYPPQEFSGEYFFGANALKEELALARSQLKEAEDEAAEAATAHESLAIVKEEWEAEKTGLQSNVLSLENEKSNLEAEMEALRLELAECRPGVIN